MFTRLCLIASLLISCTGRSRPDRNTLVVGINAQPTTLDPRWATDATGARISGLIFESFIRIGENYVPLPEAAERWSSRERTYTFHLRPDLVFHNGRKVLAEDILFSFDTFRQPGSPFASGLTEIRDVRAKNQGDHLVVEIDLKHFSKKFLVSDLPSVMILPKAEIETLGRDFQRHLIGTGPYRFGKVDINDIRLHSVRAKTPELVFKVIRDDFTRYQKLLKGEVDLVQSDLPPEKVSEFAKRSDRFQVFYYRGSTMTYLLLNLKDPLLQQKAVRQALAHVVKRQDLIRFKLYGLAREATSILAPEHPAFNSEIKNPPYNPELARQLIQEIGATGKKLTLKTTNNPQSIDRGKVLANQLSQSGLHIDLESYEWATFYSDVKKGSFQMASMKWVGIVDPDIYALAFHSREWPPGRNRGCYKNQSVDNLLDQAAATEDESVRLSLFKRVQALVHGDLAILPLWYDEQVAIAGKSVLNFKPSPTSDFSPLVQVEKRE